MYAEYKKNLFLHHIAAVYTANNLFEVLKQKGCNEGVETTLQNPK